MSENNVDMARMFLANFVHQVVNPLNGVIGTLDNIHDGTYPPNQVSQKINSCRAQIEQSVTLIRNLAFLSDYFFDAEETKSLRSVRQDVTTVLPQCIIEALQFFQIPAEQVGVKYQLDDHETQYKVKVRPELIKQVFINLFDNWQKYGLEGETIIISPKKNKHGHLVVEISAKSIGFDNKESGQLFEMGYRSKQAGNRVAQGSGIGLFICKEIMERELGGGISANHNTRSGVSTFRLWIPGEKWEI